MCPLGSRHLRGDSAHHMHYVLFDVQLLSLNIVFVMFIHIVRIRSFGEHVYIQN